MPAVSMTAFGLGQRRMSVDHVRELRGYDEELGECYNRHLTELAVKAPRRRARCLPCEYAVAGAAGPRICMAPKQKKPIAASTIPASTAEAGLGVWLPA